MTNAQDNDAVPVANLSDGESSEELPPQTSDSPEGYDPELERRQREIAELDQQIEQRKHAIAMADAQAEERERAALMSQGPLSDNEYEEMLAQNEDDGVEYYQFSVRLQRRHAEYVMMSAQREMAQRGLMEHEWTPEKEIERMIRAAMALDPYKAGMAQQSGSGPRVDFDQALGQFVA